MTDGQKQRHTNIVANLMDCRPLFKRNPEVNGENKWTKNGLTSLSKLTVHNIYITYYGVLSSASFHFFLFFNKCAGE